MCVYIHHLSTMISPDISVIAFDSAEAKDRASQSCCPLRNCGTSGMKEWAFNNI